MTARIERGGAVAIYGTTATRCDLAAETRTHQGLNSTLLRPLSWHRVMAEMGHEDQFPPRRLNARYRLS
jgi:hypothetical protein